MKKRLVAFVLLFCMLFGTIGTSHAAVVNLHKNQYSISSNEALEMLRELEFTDDEIIELYRNEAKTLNYPIELPDELKYTYGVDVVFPNNISIASLPSNPEIDSYHQVPFDINFEELAESLGYVGTVAGIGEFIMQKTKKQIANKVIVLGGLGYIWVATEIAGLILGLGSKIIGKEGIEGTQQWYYGMDNNMDIGWTPGYISYRFY